MLIQDSVVLIIRGTSYSRVSFGFRMPHVICIPMLSSTVLRYFMASRTLFMVGGKTGAVGRGTLGSFGGAGSATGLGAISNYEYYGKLNRFGNIR